MRKVKFTEYQLDKKTNMNKKVDGIEGLFHQFGVNYEEFDTGPGNYTTAIIETKDGKIHNVPVECVEFLGGKNPDGFADMPKYD